jgi:hypothetical protein
MMRSRIERLNTLYHADKHFKQSARFGTELEQLRESLLQGVFFDKDSVLILARLVKKLTRAAPHSVHTASLVQLLNEFDAVSRFGYRVHILAHKSIQDRAFIESLRHHPNEAIGLINAEGDGNCGPRAIIQSLLLRGLVAGGEAQRFVLGYLQEMYARRRFECDSRGRNMYGLSLRRLSRCSLEEARHYRNTSILVGNENEGFTLYYSDFEGQATSCSIGNSQQCMQHLKQMLGVKDFKAFVVDSPTKVHLTFDELNALTGGNPRIDQTNRIHQDMVHFFDAYRQMSRTDLGRLREAYFSDLNGYREAVNDHIIYVLAASFRFDVRHYLNVPDIERRLFGGLLENEERCYGRESEDHRRILAMQDLGQLEHDIDFNDLVGYFADHRIRCTLDGSENEINGQQRLMNTDHTDGLVDSGRFSSPELQPQVDISVYRVGAHFMSLVHESRDRVSVPQHRYPDPPHVEKVTAHGTEASLRKKERAIAAPPTTATPKIKPNYTFLMSMMAHQATKAMAVVVYFASVIFLSLVTAGIFPVAVGLVVTAGMALVGSFGLFSASVALSSRAKNDQTDRCDSARSPAP